MMKVGDSRLLQAKARLDEHRERAEVPEEGAPAPATPVGSAFAARPSGTGGGAPVSGAALAAEPGAGVPAGADSDPMNLDDGGLADMVDSFFVDRVPTRAHCEATRLYELLLILGASPGDAKFKVAELHSPPRVAKELGKLPRLSIELGAGSTFGLRADKDGPAWDFLKVGDRRRAWRQLHAERPYLVFGSPPRTAFCSLNQRLNFPKMDPG